MNKNQTNKETKKYRKKAIYNKKERNKAGKTDRDKQKKKK